MFFVTSCDIIPPVVSGVEIMTQQQTFGYACAILTAVTWAFALIFFKRSGERISPITLNLFKNSIGLAMLIATQIVLWLTGVDRQTCSVANLDLRDVGVLLLSGFLGIALADTLFFRSLNLIGVGIVAIVDCLYSPFIIIFSWVMLDEKLGPFQVVGASLVLSGVLVSSRLKPPGDRPRRRLVVGILLGALAMALMGFGIVMAKPVLERLPVVWATTVRLFAGTTSLVLLGGLMGWGKSMRAVFRPAAVWKFAVPGSVLGAYVSLLFWVAGFKYVEASVAGILNQTSTIFAIILASLILKEEFNRRKLLAIVLAMLGVVLVAWNPRWSG
jgi:drug/metabolite transporter (DMT)-like permease